MGAVLTQNTAWTNAAAALARLREAGVRLPGRRPGPVPAPPGGAGPKLGVLQPEGEEAEGDRRAVLAPAAPSLPRVRPSRESSPLPNGGSGPRPRIRSSCTRFTSPVFVVDAYTRRILSRIGLIEGRSELRATSRPCSIDSLERDAALYNEYHALIVEHAKQHCRARPECAACPVKRLPHRDRGVDPSLRLILNRRRFSATLGPHGTHRRARNRRLRTPLPGHHSRIPRRSRARTTGSVPGRLSLVEAPVISTGGAVSNVGLSLHRLGLARAPRGEDRQRSAGPADPRASERHGRGARARPRPGGRRGHLLHRRAQSARDRPDLPALPGGQRHVHRRRRPRRGHRRRLDFPFRLSAAHEADLVRRRRAAGTAPRPRTAAGSPDLPRHEPARSFEPFRHDRLGRPSLPGAPAGRHVRARASRSSSSCWTGPAFTRLAGAGGGEQIIRRGHLRGAGPARRRVPTMRACRPC